MHPCKEVVKLETFNCDKSLQKTRNAKSGETFGDSCIYHPWHPLPWSLAPPLRKLTPCIVELEPQGRRQCKLVQGATGFYLPGARCGFWR
jgi:hypothetical protein